MQRGHIRIRDSNAIDDFCRSRPQRVKRQVFVLHLSMPGWRLPPTEWREDDLYGNCDKKVNKETQERKEQGQAELQMLLGYDTYTTAFSYIQVLCSK